MVDFSTLPGCTGYFGSPLYPNECTSCPNKNLCVKVSNDSIFAQLVKIRSEIREIRKEMEVPA